MSAKYYSLSNGAEGLFLKSEGFNTTSVSFNFYLPLRRETAAANALLPFILSTCGADYPDFSALNYKLAKLYGAQLDASAEKLGDFQLLKMRISVINDRFTFESESLLKMAVEMLLSLIFNPKSENGAFCGDDLAREKRKAIEHINGEISEKRIYAKNRLIEEMYKGTAYGIPKCGTADDVAAVTGGELYKAWENMLKTAYIKVILISPALPGKLFDEISNRLSAVNRGCVTDCGTDEPTTERDMPLNVTERLPVQQGKLCLGFSSEMRGSDSETLPLMVATDIFGGGPYSRLFANVREKMSLCYYCSASSVRRKGLVTVESGVEAENADRAKREILAQLSAVKKGEFTDFEFNSSVKSLKDSLMTYNDSQETLDTWYSLKIGAGALSPSEMAEKLSSVTRESVISAAEGIKLNTVYKLLPREER